MTTTSTATTHRPQTATTTRRHPVTVRFGRPVLFEAGSDPRKAAAEIERRVRALSYEPVIELTSAA